ncbi:hypothetical protein FRC02_012419 [Tulasnella sp. 418]|nr:hypothetical protein FRC02_012419 [Tulasnella sp. 418]
MPFVLVARQDDSSSVVTIDQNAQDPATTALNFDDGADDALQTSSPSFTAPLEGTLELSDLRITRTSSPSSTADVTENAESSASEPGSAGKKQDIPLAAVVIAFVVVAVLCCALAALLWWKRKRDKQARRRERERKMDKHRQNRVGGHGHSQDKDGPWEEFKDPPALPSPGSFYSADAHQQPQPNYQHRMSVKSTVTGKVNPSNNFASYDDEDDEDDGRSMRSRGMLSPGSGKVHFHDVHPASRVAGGNDPASFLSFRSGIEGNHQFPPQPIHREGPLREGPAKVVTQSPKRSNTHKSHKGQHEVDKKAKQNNMIALTNLIAALDSQDTTHRRSFESLHSTEDNSHHPANPFQDPSFVQNLRNALPPPSPSPAR